MTITLDKTRHNEGTKVLRDYEEAYEAQRVTSNALNKAKTKARNFIKDVLDTEKLPGKTVIECDGIKYTYMPHLADKIDPRQWMTMWKKGEITEEQFFDALDVTKAKAELAIGKDQCATITVQRIGDESDLRRDAAEQGHRKGLFIIPPVVPKGIKVRKPLQAPISDKRKLKLRPAKK